MTADPRTYGGTTRNPAEDLPAGHLPNLAASGLYAWRLPLDEAGPALARSLLADAMTSLALDRDLIHDGQVAVSETVTNAHQHAPGAPVELWIHARTGTAPQLVVSVFDSAPDALPQIADADPLAEGGRGLNILTALTAGWDCRRSRSRMAQPAVPGKAVRFYLPLPPHWPGRPSLIAPAKAAHALLVCLDSRGIHDTRRSDDKGISVVELPGINVWVRPRHFSWLGPTERYVQHPLVDLHEAADALIEDLTATST